MGIVTLVWHDYSEWHALRFLVYAAAVLEIFGGVAIQFSSRRVAKVGAEVLGLAFLVFVLLAVPHIFRAPLVYNSWGNFFEQFSLLSGAGIAYAWLAAAGPREKVRRVGGVLVGICSASFGLEQAFYLGPTASLVPKWVPLSAMFWAVATTVFFGLAAVALVANWRALLAARLLTAMVVGFGVMVWGPLMVAGPRSHGNWSEIAETFAIAGTIWTLADLLGSPVGRPETMSEDPGS
jgi:hypothetical protein